MFWSCSSLMNLWSYENSNINCAILIPRWLIFIINFNSVLNLIFILPFKIVMEDIHDEVANLRTNLSSLQSVTNSLGTYSLISLSRYCSSNFCRSSESTEHLLKVDLKVLPANDNPQTASSWSVIRASLLVETYI